MYYSLYVMLCLTSLLLVNVTTLTHTAATFVYQYIFVRLFICLFVYQSICMIVYLSVCLPVYLYNIVAILSFCKTPCNTTLRLFVPIVYLTVCLPLYLYDCYIWQSICLLVYLYDCLFYVCFACLCLFTCCCLLTVSLFVYQCCQSVAIQLHTVF